MESNTDKTVKVTLRLNEEEARWLKALVQNVLLYIPKDEQVETTREETIRLSFWNALGEI